MTEFREFWTRDEPKGLTEPTELKESKDLTKSEKRTSELEPVQNYQTGPVRPVTGRFKKCFRPVKTGENRQKPVGISRPFTVG